MARHEIIRAVQPSRMQRIWQAVRSYTLPPLSLSDPAVRKYFSSGGSTSTGLSVSEYTALNYSAVWAAVRLISNDVAGLPLHLFRKSGNVTERYDSHPLYRLLHDSPNPEMSSFTFRQTLQAHVLTWGNGYAEIERDVAGRARYLWPLTPDRVDPFRDGDLLRYRVRNEKGMDVILDASSMVHLRGLGWDGVQGYSPIAKARESIALGMAAEKFGATFYGNGSTFGGVLTHPTTFKTPGARENFEKSLRNRHHGVERANGLLLLEEGITYEKIGIPPNEAQFLESRQFQITEIARWYNLPPYKLADMSRLTYNTIEAHAIEYYQSLLPWLETWEQELMWKLISPLERNQQYIEHSVEGLLRADSAGRAALEATEFNIGAITPNEARALANRNPVAGGDRAFVQGNMIAVDRYDEWMDAQIASMTAKANPPSGDGGNRSEAIAIEIRTLATSLDAVRGELSEAHKANAELVDDMTAAKIATEHEREARDAAERRASELESRLEALTEQLAVNASLLKDAEERLSIVTKAKEERDAAVAMALAERDVEKAGRDGMERAAKQLGQQIADLTAQADAIAAERDEALTAQSHLSELLDGAGAALAAEQAERSREGFVAAARIAALERSELEDDATIATLRTELAESQSKLEATKAEHAAALEKLVTERNEFLETIGTATDAATRAIAAKEASDAVAALMTAERDTAKADAAAIDATLTERLNIEAQRIAAVMVAHRALLADAMRRVLAKETDRARRHQATPQKLRAWMETFYPDHVETVADVLQPVVAAEIAWRRVSDDPATVARAMAEAHCQQSLEQLRMVAAVEDYSGTLERTLQRWEATRPEQMADRVMQEGVSHVRSL